ncbi:hypothetical protein C8R43DRAFT_1130516 [Mycena crocata]|nr:hypothetical protein C8R43DRAFT_1130516 [Mycena crocata]
MSSSAKNRRWLARVVQRSSTWNKRVVHSSSFVVHTDASMIYSDKRGHMCDRAETTPHLRPSQSAGSPVVLISRECIATTPKAEASCL